MRKYMLWFCGGIVALLMAPAEALCDGYGFYAWGRGWPSVGVPGLLEEQLPQFKGLNIDLRNDHFTFGYLYDGASTPEDRYGWRFSFGADIVLTNFEGSNAPGGLSFGIVDLASEVYDSVGYGFATKLAYGIGIVRKTRVRVWVGPSIGLTADYVDQKGGSFEQGSISVEVVDPWGVIVSAGGGIEGGVRYAVGPELTLDLSTGFHYNFFGFYQDADLKVNSQSLGSDKSFFTGQEPFMFVQIALRFDFNKDQHSR